MANTNAGQPLAGRSVAVLPDDTFIVSYPRSGNTWARFLIGNLICPEPPIDFMNIETRVPDIYRNADEELTRIPRPRILKSHERFDPRYRNVIYVVRDPRDVAVSYYYYHLKQRWIDDGYPLDEFVMSFVHGGIKYGSWAENVTSWLQSPHDDHRFMVVQYASMVANTRLELTRIANFLQVNLSTLDVDRVMMLSSAATMRRLEQEQSDVWRTIKDSRKDIPFVRSASSGAWKTLLSDTSVQLVERTWQPLMQTLGYIE